MQYTHARLCSLIRKHEKPISGKADFKLLSTDEEASIIKLLENFPQVVKYAAENYEPSFICTFLIDLCAAFNHFYQKHRIITEDTGLTDARMLMVKTIQITLKNGLSLLGIQAPEKM